jgi:2-oxoisovalerate dehydrogenase E1 component
VSGASHDSAARIDAAFTDAVAGMGVVDACADDAPVRAGSQLTAAAARDIFEAQMISRQLDLAARWLRGRGEGFYTIASSGHEGNACVAAALRVDDPAFLHYRSGAFYVARARQHGEVDPVQDVLLGLVASAEEPIAGGRHKVFGRRELAIAPQTSTIASHLPKAVGVAFALDRAHRLGLTCRTPRDAVVMCSFGDASLNHSTAAGSLNTACRIAHQRMPVPILFMCEDNGLGISVRTPTGWVRDAVAGRPQLRYFEADGCDLAAAHDAARTAVEFVRSERRPAFLHLHTVRLMGHAGSDVEMVYRSRGEIAADESRDPLVHGARILTECGAMTPEQICERYRAIGEGVRAAAAEAINRPKLTSAAEVMEPLAPRDPDAIAAAASMEADATARVGFWEHRLPEDDPPAPLSVHLNRALGDLLLACPELLVFGEDVGRKGGVYGVTRGLDKRAGMARVFDTILDEQTILGSAIGAAHLGFVPVPEIQYLAYLHNAEDQLRGEAATLQFFSRDQYRNPMVVRIASYAYQKGFGGHFHNDNSVAVLRDIPGLVVASPSRGDDAAAMLRTCVAAARTGGTVSAFLEPIALYATRDLYTEGDGLWQSTYVPAGRHQHVPIGAARVYGDGADLLLVSFANGVPMSLRVARRLEQTGTRCRVLDLRWLAPLPVDDLLREAERVGRVLVVDETRAGGGVSEGVIAALVDGGYRGALARVTSRDSLVPLGEAANLVLLAEEDVEGAARSLLS